MSRPPREGMSPQRRGSLERQALAKQASKGITLDANFLLACSDATLANYELARLAEVADLRSELQIIIDRMIDTQAQAAIARWFRNQDRASLKNAIESPEEAIARIAAQAEAQIRDGQRSAEELIPRTSLEPGAAHLAAALRYQERNITEGKCQNCPQPLDPRSHRYCTKHLAMERNKYTPKRKRTEPGTRSWLYGESLEPGDGRSLVKDRQKMRRIAPAGKELLARVAKQLGVTPEHVRSVALGDRRSDRISDAIAKEFETLRQAGVSGDALVKKGKD